MGKKDFSSSTENVFDDFFTQPVAIKKKEEVKAVKTKPTEEKKEVKVTPKKEETKKEKAPKQAETVMEETTKDKTTKEAKSHIKESRFNFYLDIELIDFVTNYLWITRQKNCSQYFNHLIKQDLLKRLGLPEDTTNEVLSQKWEEYKKENNL